MNRANIYVNFCPKNNTECRYSPSELPSTYRDGGFLILRGRRCNISVPILRPLQRRLFLTSHRYSVFFFGSFLLLRRCVPCLVAGSRLTSSPKASIFCLPLGIGFVTLIFFSALSRYFSTNHSVYLVYVSIKKLYYT